MTPRRGGTAAGSPGAAPNGAVVTIDIAHPPMRSEEAEAALDATLRSALLSGRVRIVRIIHGYGSGGKGGTLRTTARNWAFRRKGKVAAVIPGESYSPLDPLIAPVLREAGIPLDAVGPADQGVTLLVLR